MSTEALDPIIAASATKAQPGGFEHDAAQDGDAQWDLIIKPRSGWIALNLGDLWRYRELLYFLTWRDMKLRYQQTALGALWAIIQPLLTMVVFTVIFGHFAKVPSEGVPYPIFSFCALLPWTFFAYALSQSSNSLVGNANLISKVYFPRLVIPVASTLSGLIDLAIGFAVLVVMMAIYGIRPTVAIVALPLLVVYALLAALAVGIWLSALNVEYRDVRYAIPFLTQIWMYATPIVYPLSLVKNNLAQIVFSLNPMTGVVDGFRWALLGSNSFDSASIAVSSSVTILGLAGGLIYFRRMERQFADVV